MDAGTDEKTDRKDYFAEAATARQRVGADDSEQAGEATEPDCHHDPIRLKPRPTSMRRPTFGRPPAARTRPTSILAFGSGSRASRLPAPISRFLVTDHGVIDVVAGLIQATAESQKPVPLSF